MKYPRFLEKELEKWLFKGKILILYGARQVGKTTLSKDLLGKHPKSLYLNCELTPVKTVLESRNPESIKSYFGGAKLVVLDEAQKIKDAGLILKIIHDTYPDIQIIATGSSSFDLGSKVSEPLTGRNLKFTLYPLSLAEILEADRRTALEGRLEHFLRFGLYPDIADEPESAAQVKLAEIAGDYLYKDVLEFESIKKSDLLIRLLKALALQLGNEVSYREIAGLLRVTPETIERYIMLLERSFVIFRLPPFSRNLRKELSGKNKIYFYDVGIRNALLENYTRPELRNDIGALWENFCITERMKRNQAAGRRANLYFWRTYDQKEIDYIEESGGTLSAFEFKWNPRKIPKPPADFMKTYKGSSFQVVSQDNYMDFVT